MADTKISALSAVTDVIGTDEFVLARSGTTKKIDGVDLAVALGSAVELDYVERTTNLTVTATTAAGANDFIVGNAVSYDGSTRIRIEFFAPIAESSQFVQVSLWDGSTDLGILADAASGGIDVPVMAVRYLTPSAATHTYKIKAFRGTGSATLYASTGGVPNDYVPAFMRITTA